MDDNERQENHMDEQKNHMDEINHMTKLHNMDENDCSLCMWISLLPLQTSLLPDHVGPFISKKFPLHPRFQIILDKVFALNHSSCYSFQTNINDIDNRPGTQCF